ncbi:hypothetical protein [Mesorhizobium sp. IMUNJ 23232]|uniref:hypothetical protein n=1 Tax=Mesorhizobium sp. IMUNJ 23232 TaxID=3376064 RepID=UPI00379DAF18
MPLALLVLAATLALPVLSTDDPAVLVCEMMVKASLRAPKSFVRAAEPVIDETTVTLAFTAFDAHNRTVRQTRTCRFKLAGDGRFHLEPFRRDDLEARLDAAKAKLRKAAPGNDMMLARSQILDIGREMYVNHDRMRKAERQAARAGLYPIAPGLTRLGQ